MKFNDRLKLNVKSKLYIPYVVACISLLFIVVAIVFWSVIKNYNNQSPQETYSYFLMILDRWMFGIFILGIVPISIYQWLIKNKTVGDFIVSVFSVILLGCFCIAFYCGEAYIMQKYQNGELSSSVTFCQPTIETRIFDTIIRFQGENPPVMCLPVDFYKKIK